MVNAFFFMHSIYCLSDYGDNGPVIDEMAEMLV